MEILGIELWHLIVCDVGECQGGKVEKVEVEKVEVEKVEVDIPEGYLA